MPTDLPLTLNVVSLGNRVGGIARPDDGPAVFIPGALPGETVKARIVTRRKNHCEAILLEVIEPSPERVSPFCPLHGKCGGCSLQHLEYGSQLFWKRRWIQKALNSFPECTIDGVTPSPETRGFRNRVTFDVIEGMPCLHAYRGDPFPVQDCPALDSSGRVVLGEILRTGVPAGVNTISIRCSNHTGGTLVEVDGKADGLPDAWGPARSEKSAPGTNQLIERLLKWTFPIPPGGFFQVNTPAAELLLGAVLEHATGGKTLDLYGGAGTFGIPLACRGAPVESVETNMNAANAARAAAAMNGATGFKSFCESDASFLSRACRAGRSFDTVILDPPRAGAGAAIMEMLARVSRGMIIYISCNPFTAARDLAVLAAVGFGLKKAMPVDMFPHTDHVETVLLLERTGV